MHLTAAVRHMLENVLLVMLRVSLTIRLHVFLKAAALSFLFSSEVDCKPPVPYRFHIPFIMSSLSCLKVNNLSLFHLHLFHL